MKLQTKLIGAFGVLTAITLLVSLLSWWEVNRLGSALYEVGVVRLPSIRGLRMMSDAISDLHESERTILATENLTVISEEVDRQRRAWRRFDDGWNLYEPLPQTPEEAKLWREFVPVAKAWREEYAKVLAALSLALDQRDLAGAATGRRRFATTSQAAFSRVGAGLSELTALNFRIADDAKQSSIANYGDLSRVRTVMLAASIVSALSAVAFGLAVGRKISRPIAEVANAFSRVAAGDRTVRVENYSLDEVSQMGQALNHMVEELQASEHRLRLVSDNLPDSMVYQLQRGPDGTRRFLHVSAGVERIHGLTVAAVLADPSRLYDQIVEEDRARLRAAEEASFHTLEVFQLTARIRRSDGAVRWVQLRSQPRREPGGAVIWDGLETDVTTHQLAQAERERLAHAIDEHFDAAYWFDRECRIVYVNAAAARATGYTREELIGQPLLMISPRATPEAMQGIWRELRERDKFRVTHTVHRTKDGRDYPVEITTQRVSFGGEELACGFARDITDRTRTEEALQRQLAELKRWQGVTLDREDRVLELKTEINALSARLGEPARYPSQRPPGAAIG